MILIKFLNACACLTHGIAYVNSISIKYNLNGMPESTVLYIRCKILRNDGSKNMIVLFFCINFYYKLQYSLRISVCAMNNPLILIIKFNSPPNN